MERGGVLIKLRFAALKTKPRNLFSLKSNKQYDIVPEALK